MNKILLTLGFVGILSTCNASHITISYPAQDILTKFSYPSSSSFDPYEENFHQKVASYSLHRDVPLWSYQGLSYNLVTNEISFLGFADEVKDVLNRGGKVEDIFPDQYPDYLKTFKRHPNAQHLTANQKKIEYLKSFIPGLYRIAYFSKAFCNYTYPTTRQNQNDMIDNGLFDFDPNFSRIPNLRLTNQVPEDVALRSLSRIILIALHSSVLNFAQGAMAAGDEDKTIALQHDYAIPFMKELFRLQQEAQQNNDDQRILAAAQIPAQQNTASPRSAQQTRPKLSIQHTDGLNFNLPEFQPNLSVNPTNGDVDIPLQKNQSA